MVIIYNNYIKKSSEKDADPITLNCSKTDPRTSPPFTFRYSFFSISSIPTLTAYI